MKLIPDVEEGGLVYGDGELTDGPSFGDGCDPRQRSAWEEERPYAYKTFRSQ